ncbi:Dolichyl-diphosphooligosaccharide-protein glycosyltransferase subunit 1 [Zancudomyces culisetae]|uniref:Dolichyl-diphosphooligosaccharide--protein glycosyltransferase subunit 1 n=1 Tax=Zancudomyces culisetae TaxID=1213189 RepID=A0A1R1PGY1_ZANCU|nr:Dolichyl-diphosphooligosaccharide-protein glycosyltransferase subunit 1 [Zancudomyces culisetae]|eukprot:OMH80234.1 Dolichyl-diphosphooligosaccharide-protein glycosyltransferase subunit 1 [Zancudomyces culisetae]
MTRYHSLVVAILLLLYSIHATLINKNIIREVDLSDQAYTEIIRILVLNKNEGISDKSSDEHKKDRNKSPQGDKEYEYYELLIPKSLEMQMGSIKAAEIKTKTPMSIKRIGTIAKLRKDNEGNVADDINSKNANGLYVLYKVKFAQPLKPEERISFKVTISAMQKLQALPAEIEFGGSGSYVYEREVHVVSLYETENQKTIIRLPQGDTESYSLQPEPVNKDGKTITYGPYKNVKPYSISTTDSQVGPNIRVHFVSDLPYLEVRKNTREVTISHFTGTTRIVDFYDVYNNGPAFKGGFSRIDYYKLLDSKAQRTIPRDFSIGISGSAKNIFYKDEVGNVTSSKIYEPGSSGGSPMTKVLVLSPRYPLAGGWHYSWNHGYDSNLSSNLRFDKSTGLYNFAIPFIVGLSELPVREYELSIVLPEGAIFSNFHIPFELEETKFSQVYSFLDSVGRTKITFKLSNVVSDHTVPIVLSYRYPTYAYLIKPLSVAAFLLVLFISSMFISRLDLSLSKRRHLKTE